MQNRNFIKIIVVVFAIICAYQLSFTWVANGVEEDAAVYASDFKEGSEREAKKMFYLDSIMNKTVYDIGLAQYTYLECKKREISLGLDLQGGMNVTLEVEVGSLLKDLSNNNKDADFNSAIKSAKKIREKNAQNKTDFLTLFGEEYEKISPNKGMAILFKTQLKEKIKSTATNQAVMAVLKGEVEDAISSSFNILRSRIDRFGVTQPNIQRINNTAKILVELPGVKDPKRAKKLLQTTAQLEFWETYKYADLSEDLIKANKAILDKAKEKEGNTEEVVEETPVADEEAPAEEAPAEEAPAEEAPAEEIQDAGKGSLFAILTPNVVASNNPTPIIGFCAVTDTAELSGYLKADVFRECFKENVRFAYSAKVAREGENNAGLLKLYALKSSRNGKPSMEGDAVEKADAQMDANNRWEISMTMNEDGKRKWKTLTGKNIGRSVAIVLDGLVSSAPTVQAEISKGRSSITGDFTQTEAIDLVNVLKSGKLPVSLAITDESIVGPSLGEEAISSGLSSFIFALLLVLAYMIFYYNGAGIVANIALLANLFFVFGVLASLGAVLTLPGIAGIILTIGMSVDANVLIFERIREEMRNGKGLRLAITDGYNNAYSSIIDANVTTLLTGIILYTFGTGPIKGFAITLIVGILTSLFAAIFITRLVISARLNKGKTISFATKMTEGAFKNINFDFIGKRKIFYIFSSIIILLGVGSLATKGLHRGVDFVGGRTYVISFDEAVDNEKLRAALSDVFVDPEGLRHTPEVKTVTTPPKDKDDKPTVDGNRVKITTSFMIESNDNETIEAKLKEGLTSMGVGFKRLSQQKVGPTIADDVWSAAKWSIFFSLLVIFLYILVRFRKWQFSLGAVAAVFHDVLIVLSIFSFFYGILPFSLEIDQAFIAAILTIIGYSLNDTVVVFDRIREYMRDNKKKGVHELVNGALNSTLSRTINTSLTTFCVLLIIFIFGAESIKGFMFALMVGVVVGTYSSLFVASPIMMDAMKKKEEKSKRT